MENTLHHQLKEIYREDGSDIEVKLGRYRIDVVNGKRLVEIQRSGLSSIRRKILNLCEQGYLVDVVKPVVARKKLVKLTRKNGRVSDARWSPKKNSILGFFDELIYFTEVFPHPNLKMIVPMITVEEIRFPGHGRKRRRRKGNFQVKDRKILEVLDSHEFTTVGDLQKLVPGLPKEWDTGELAKAMSVPRWEAQKIAYVLRKTGTAKEVGKRGNAIVCRFASAKEARDELSAKKTKRKSIKHIRTVVEAHKQRLRKSSGVSNNSQKTA
ncbi:hypothetical protein [Mariniblastus fucicola]|uniref:DUF8091 domain-containing protein n=1 Tax=Mariniblastus fucicola TaxID=980251 RepID=A0A5B9PIS4_9BACT|nr:hypothetical protein [Mariniblastus fucicola]QEG24562.1 hypothetical protein MFFC18_44820 [Mariniblastus fucicola]